MIYCHEPWRPNKGAETGNSNQQIKKEYELEKMQPAKFISWVSWCENTWEIPTSSHYILRIMASLSLFPPFTRLMAIRGAGDEQCETLNVALRVPLLPRRATVDSINRTPYFVEQEVA